jgi:hypothetical protein
VPGREDHPINCISWAEASTYCGWAGTVAHKRLPTEAEWEKAARGDDARIYPWGDVPLPSCTHVSMNEGPGGGCGNFSSLPVGSKPLGDSPYGVHDMAGGVWEWTADWYGVYDVAEDDNPTGPSMGTFRPPRRRVGHHRHQLVPHLGAQPQQQQQRQHRLPLRPRRRAGDGIAKGAETTGPDPSLLLAESRSAAYRWRSLYFSMSSLVMLAGTSPYLANSIVYSALPCVAERSSVEYPNMSERGTFASIEVVP